MATAGLLFVNGQVAANPDSAAAAGRTPKLAALLDEHPIGIPNKIIFKLERSVGNYRYWDVVYQSPWAYSYTGNIGLGYEDRVFTKLHPNRTGSTIRLKLTEPVPLWVAVLGTLGLGVGLLALGARSWLPRITLPRASSTAPMPTLVAARPPIILAKVQIRQPGAAAGREQRHLPAPGVAGQPHEQRRQRRPSRRCPLLPQPGPTRTRRASSPQPAAGGGRASGRGASRRHGQQWRGKRSSRPCGRPRHGAHCARTTCGLRAQALRSCLLASDESDFQQLQGRCTEAAGPWRGLCSSRWPRLYCRLQSLRHESDVLRF